MRQASAIVNREHDHQQTSRSPYWLKLGTTEPNVGQVERWGSVLGGASLAWYGLSRRSIGGAVLSLVGASLMYRGVTGRCHLYEALEVNTATRNERAPRGVHVEKTITILTSPAHLYRFWRRFDNLPCFMWRVQSVQTTSDRRLHWVAQGPLGKTVEWDAEIVEDRENELIAWRSLEGARLPNDGCVRFRQAPGGRGTELHVMFNYDPPLGKLGGTVAKLFAAEPGQQLGEDLHRLKCFIEAGEIPTTEGQPSGRIAMRSAHGERRRQQWLRTSRQQGGEPEMPSELLSASDLAGRMDNP